jgi:putative hydrolase of the HAD superfamily
MMKSLKTQIKAIIFDWGGVLIDNPVDAMVSFFVKKLKVPADKLVKAYQTYLDDHQRGRIDENELWQHMGRDLQLNIPQETPSLWTQAVASSFKTRKKVLQLAQQYKDRGYKMALLSNTEPAAVAYYKNQVKYPMMDATVFSCEVGMAKPDPGIYTITLDRLAVTAEQALFIDDRLDFIATAQKLGLQTIHFRNEASLQKKLMMLTD